MDIYKKINSLIQNYNLKLVQSIRYTNYTPMQLFIEQNRLVAYDPSQKLKVTYNVENNQYTQHTETKGIYNYIDNLPFFIKQSTNSKTMSIINTISNEVIFSSTQIKHLFKIKNNVYFIHQHKETSNWELCIIDKNNKTNCYTINNLKANNVYFCGMYNNYYFIRTPFEIIKLDFNLNIIFRTKFHMIKKVFFLGKSVMLNNKLLVIEKTSNSILVFEV